MFLPSREVEKVSARKDIGEAKAKLIVTIPCAPSLTPPPTFPALANSPLFPCTSSTFSPLLCPSPNQEASKSGPWVTALC